MLKIIEYKGAEYPTGKKIKILPDGIRFCYLKVYKDEYRNDYIRFEWDNGHLDMTKYHWDKLPKKKKNLIYKLAKGESV